MLVVLPMINFRSAKKIEVLEIEIYEGEGTSNSPGRLVTYYTDLNGKALSVNDPREENKIAISKEGTLYHEK